MSNYALREAISIEVKFFNMCGNRLFIGAGIPEEMVNTFEAGRYGDFYISQGQFDEISARYISIMVCLNHSKIEYIKHLRDQFQWGLKKSKVVADSLTEVLNNKLTWSYETVIFQPVNPLALSSVQPHRALITVGKQYGAPTVVNVAFTSRGGSFKPHLDELYKWAQNDSISWPLKYSSIFEVISCSRDCKASGPASMSYGDTVFIYSEGIPGWCQEWLCDHNDWTLIEK